MKAQDQFIVECTDENTSGLIYSESRGWDSDWVGDEILLLFP
jgi:hypothetical protein